MKLLMDTGKVDFDSKDNNGQAPLSLAAANGREAIVKRLFDNNAEVNSQGGYFS
jgi:ankyrin repeat protein